MTIIFITFSLLEHVLETKHVTIETLQAAICVYLLIGLSWVFVYTLIDVIAPSEFQFPRGPRFHWTGDRSRRAEFMRLFFFSYSIISSWP